MPCERLQFGNLEHIAFLCSRTKQKPRQDKGYKVHVTLTSGLSKTLYGGATASDCIGLARSFYRLQTIGTVIATWNGIEFLKFSDHKEIKDMGKLAETQQSLRDFPPFAKMANIAGVPHLCILGIRSYTNKDGKEQWALDILLPEDERDAMDNKDGRVTVTLSKSPGRDALMSQLQTKLPVHNVAFEEKQMKGGRSFYDLVEIPGLCACGEYEEEPAPQYAGDELPF